MENNWYVGKTGNHQGLVIEEGTGRNVAVAYDKADAQLLAAAPDLLATLKDVAMQLPCWDNDCPNPECAVVKARAAISKAEERS